MNATGSTSLRVSRPIRNAQVVPVSIIVPCFNEFLACQHLRARLSQFATQTSDKYRLSYVLVDDGSTDGTFEALQRCFKDFANCQIVRHPENLGVGAAIMTGIRQADSEIVCSMDFDCTYDPCQFDRMIPLLRDGVDLVTASPYHPDGSVRNVPSWRLALSKAASMLYRQVLRNQLFTYTSCFRVYRRSAVVDIQLTNNGFVGVVELLWELDRRGSRIVECPAELGVREYGQSKMRTLQVMRDHLRLMLGRLLWLK